MTSFGITFGSGFSGEFALVGFFCGCILGGRMFADRSSGDMSPLAWVGSLPIYASTALAGAHAVAMIGTALTMAAGAEWLIHIFQFSSVAVLGQFSIWQLGTYAFVQPPSLFFVIGLYMFLVFGQEIEKFLGRRAFLAIYFILLLLPSLTLSLATLAGFSSLYWGLNGVSCGIFVAFATLYPTAEMILGIQARWIAICVVTIGLLQALAASDFTELAILIVDSCAGFFLVRYWCGGKIFPQVHRYSIYPFYAVQRPKHSPVLVDGILEKISRSGISSLTRRERAQLDGAREELLKRKKIDV